MQFPNYFIAYLLCVQTRGVDSRERLQGLHFYGVHGAYQIFKGIQDTTDLDNSFASELSAQALESDHLDSKYT